MTQSINQYLTAFKAGTNPKQEDNLRNGPALFGMPDEILRKIVQQVATGRNKIESGENAVNCERVCVLTNAIIKTDPEILAVVKGAQDSKAAEEVMKKALLALVLAVGVLFSSVFLLQLLA